MDRWTLTADRQVAELQSRALLYTHNATGARYLKLQNTDDEKVFSITFRTPPTDDTGCPHIAEHCALAGSRDYRTKEPFVDLLKGSLQTFLNAFTYLDHTVFPVATRNRADLANLRAVYLDAVFHPRVADTADPVSKMIFDQEGWRHHAESASGPLTLNGVVLNEMRGAYSNPDELLSTLVQKAMFPDTPARFDSGGDPAKIPSLRYEDFLEFHRRNYHPSNSYSFSWGDGDVEEELRTLDKVFAEFQKRDASHSEMPVQGALREPAVVRAEYASASEEGESKDDKHYCAIGWQTGRSANAEQMLAMEILDRILVEREGASLKEAVIKSGISTDVQAVLDLDALQPTWTLLAKHCKPGSAERLQQVVFDSLKSSVRDGFPKDVVESCVNRIEFTLREANFRRYPKGVAYATRANRTWIYGGDPLLALAYEKPLASLKAGVAAGGYFERLVSDLLVNNTHRVLLELAPSPGLATRQSKELEVSLSEVQKKIGEAGMTEVVRKTKEFAEWHDREDSQEALATIPRLALSEISKTAEQFPVSQSSCGGGLTTVIHHETFCGGIVYCDLYFDVSSLLSDGKSLPLLGLLAKTLKKMSTSRHTYGELSTLIDLHTGGISASNQAISARFSDTVCKPKLVIKTKTLRSKLNQLPIILGELLRDTVFSDHKRLLEVVKEVRSNVERYIQSSGHSLALHRLLAGFSPRGRFVDGVDGVDFYRFLVQVEESWSDASAAGLAANLAAMMASIFTRTNVLVSLTCSGEDYQAAAAALPTLLDHLPQQVESSTSAQSGDDEEYTPKREALVLGTSSVNYVALGFNYRRVGFPSSGALRVLDKIVDLDYLWQRIRVAGGAYGTGPWISRDGTFALYSYRDPRCAGTLEDFSGVVDYVDSIGQKAVVDAKALQPYIVGTIGELDSSRTPQMKGEEAATRWIAGYLPEDWQRERDEVLATTTRDLHDLRGLVSRVLEKASLCAVVNESTAAKERSSFDTVSTLIK